MKRLVLGSKIAIASIVSTASLSSARAHPFEHLRCHSVEDMHYVIEAEQLSEDGMRNNYRIQAFAHTKKGTLRKLMDRKGTGLSEEGGINITFKGGKLEVLPSEDRSVRGLCKLLGKDEFEVECEDMLEK